MAVTDAFSHWPAETPRSTPNRLKRHKVAGRSNDPKNYADCLRFDVARFRLGRLSF